MAATSTSELLESRRRAYLRALGIPLFHPRQQLPGALPSARLASVPAALAATATAAPAKPAGAPIAPPVSAKTVGQRPSAQAALAQLQAAAAPVNPASRATPSIAVRPSIEVTSSPRVTPAAAAKDRIAERDATRPTAAVESIDAQVESAAFAFAFVPVNEQVAVINELPRAGAPALTAASRQLLAGILKALTLPCEERNLSSLSFVWPSPDLPPTEQGPAHARELLKGFLARRFSIRPVRYLLVLAEQGTPYLFPAGFTIKEGSLFRHPDFDVQVLVTRSLGAMEVVPTLKREVWTAVQPLLGALQGSHGESLEEPTPDRRQDP